MEMQTRVVNVIFMIDIGPKRRVAVSTIIFAGINHPLVKVATGRFDCPSWVWIVSGLETLANEQASEEMSPAQAIEAGEGAANALGQREGKGFWFCSVVHLERGHVMYR